MISLWQANMMISHYQAMLIYANLFSNSSVTAAGAYVSAWCRGRARRSARRRRSMQLGRKRLKIPIIIDDRT